MTDQRTASLPPNLCPSQCSAVNDGGGRCMLNFDHGGNHAFLVDMWPYRRIKELEALLAGRARIEAPEGRQPSDVLGDMDSVGPFVRAPGKPIHSHNPTRVSQPELDEARWQMVAEAITTKDLPTDWAKLCAIWSVVESRRPLTAAETQRGQEIAQQLGLLADHALRCEARAPVHGRCALGADHEGRHQNAIGERFSALVSQGEAQEPT